MKKITQEVVREVKAHGKQTFHGQEWWRIENMETTTAVQTAIFCCGAGASIKEIAASATKIMDL